VAGTTRDVVSQTIQIEGVPLHVIDTAGLRESDDAVEKIGIERAWGQIEAADAVLFLHDLTRATSPDYVAGDAAVAAALATRLPSAVPVIDVWNKVDAAPAASAPPVAGHDSILLSARTGAGLDALRRKLLQVAGWQSAPEGVGSIRTSWRRPRCWRARPKRSTCWLRNCGWRKTRSMRSPANSARTTCSV
jgi:tRNA modification GTPase